MCVKLTEFMGGGAVLGITINHGLMDAAGLKGRVAYARWSGDDARFAWEVGVGRGKDGKLITGV